MNAAMIAHVDPVAVTLPEIEAIQATLAELAARHRAEMDGPPEGDVETAFARRSIILSRISVRFIGRNTTTNPAKITRFLFSDGQKFYRRPEMHQR